MTASEPLLSTTLARYTDEHLAARASELAPVMPHIEAELAAHRPRVVHVDGDNRIVAIGDDGAQPVPGMDDQIDGRTSHGVR